MKLFLKENISYVNKNNPIIIKVGKKKYTDKNLCIKFNESEIIDLLCNLNKVYKSVKYNFNNYKEYKINNNITIVDLDNNLKTYINYIILNNIVSSYKNLYIKTIHKNIKNINDYSSNFNYNDIYFRELLSIIINNLLQLNISNINSKSNTYFTIGIIIKKPNNIDKILNELNNLLNIINNIYK